MAKEWAVSFYKSRAWQRCREGYIASVDGLCETCLDKGLITPGLIVHHKVVLNPCNIGDPSVSLNWELLRLECLNCHNVSHGMKTESLRDGLAFDGEGNIVSLI